MLMMLYRQTVSNVKVFSKRLMGTLTGSPPAATSRSGSAVSTVESLHFGAKKSYDKMPRVSSIKAQWLLNLHPRSKYKMQEVVEDWHKKHGPIFKIDQWGKQMDTVWIENPETMQFVFKKDGSNPIAYRFGHPHLEGEEWEWFRGKTHKQFLRPTSVRGNIKTFSEVADDFVEFIAESSDATNEVDDLEQLCYRWALENTLEMVWDYRLGALRKHVPPNSHASDLIQCIRLLAGTEGRSLWARRNFGKVADLWINLTHPGSKKRYIQMQMRIQEISTEVLKEALDNVDMEKLETTEYNDLTLFEKLVKDHGKDSKVQDLLTRDGIGAGVETPGKTMMFFIYDLATNPDKQEILYQEILNVFGPDGEITDKGLNQILKKYLRPCFLESQRCHPLVFGISRISQVDMPLEGFMVPKGTKINYCMMNRCKDPEPFPEPHKFLPERWLRDHPLEHNAHPFATLHFSFGPRMCLGRRFAELEFYILMIKILKRFKLEYHHEEVKMLTEFVTRPDKKVKVRFVPRK